MLAIASALMVYVAVAAAYAAGARKPHLPQPLPARAKSALVAASALALIAATILWPQRDGVAMAVIAVLLCLSAMATLFVILEPVAPRLMWWTARLAPPVAAMLAFLGCR